MSGSREIEHSSNEQQAVAVSPGSGEASVLNLAGEIDIARAGELKDEFLNALQGGKPIHVKIGDLSGLDVTGLQLLWAARRAAGQLGVDFAVSGEPAEPIQHQLAELGMEELEIFA